MLSGLTVPPLLAFQSQRPRRLLVFESGGRSWLRSPASLHIFPSQPQGSFSPLLVARSYGTLSLPRGGHHFVLLRQFNIGLWSSSKGDCIASDSRLFGALEAPPISLVCFGRLRGPGLQDYCALVGGCRELRFMRAAPSASIHELPSYHGCRQ
ncbi:hypothetical protein NDU88_000568 [Pleurodeles waltl]|uniref:Uncharacterized protein n=1 Tax=Pleurodeles waltl TaxID=8319 RepID=A0AAV7UUF1_PLEWA|nr:hypothetical protein NDU88_000568 [Pleurodeles waltl]